jgi:NAD-dependent DNA ligase
LDAAEEAEILELLLQCVGANAPACGEASGSTSLPFTHPAPVVHFVDQVFCFTGKFFSGTRQWCEGQVTARGGALGAISRKLNYLVVGEIGSRDWIHSTHGRKIEKAMEYVNAGQRLAIIGEQHWASYLGELRQ